MKLYIEVKLEIDWIISEIIDKKIDFEEECNSFLNDYAFNDLDDEDDEDE